MEKEIEEMKRTRERKDRHWGAEKKVEVKEAMAKQESERETGERGAEGEREVRLEERVEEEIEEMKRTRGREQRHCWAENKGDMK